MKPITDADDLSSFIIRWRHWIIFVALVLAVLFATVAAFLLRFEFAIPSEERGHLRGAMLVALIVKLPILYRAKAHRGWFQFSGLRDLRRILGASIFGSIGFTVACLAAFGAAFPRSVYLLDGFFLVAVLCAMRALIRWVRESRPRVESVYTKDTIIYGAGRAGVSLAQEIQQNPRANSRVVGFLDDAPHLQNEFVAGLPVLGFGSKAAQIVKDLRARKVWVDEILIAIPSAPSDRMTEIVENCRATGLTCRTLPAIADLLHSRNLSAQVRDIRLEDLLARETVALSEDSIRHSLFGKRVMITGAAGSIGSELAMHVAQFGPERLVLFDIAESQLFETDHRLRAAGYSGFIHPVIGDVRDVAQVETAMHDHAIETVFHAAAYKHVPLMEEHPVQAAVNNVIGTFNVAETAYRLGVKKFTLISTDKAVNPTSVMGATKRAAELIVCSYPPGRTNFSAVRFGNVLGSNGSVVPLFQTQIARGGPVTVTHPDVTRYFMTVREAVQLVLQASTMGKGSEIYVLDMGKPVRILDMANNVIRLAGLTPGIDVRIDFIGLRPGEKLYEELIAQGEHIRPTHHNKIKIYAGPVADRERILRWVDDLSRTALRRENEPIVRHLESLIPEYLAAARWERDAVSAPRQGPASEHGGLPDPHVANA